MQNHRIEHTDFSTWHNGGVETQPPPSFDGPIEQWEDWSWQVKRYVSLLKCSEVEGKADEIIKTIAAWEVSKNSMLAGPATQSVH